MTRPALIVLFWSLGVSTAVNQQQDSSSPPFVLNAWRNKLARHDAKGNVVWSVKFTESISSTRPPHMLWDESRVYVAHSDGVTALDAGNGKMLWRAEGPDRGLLLSDGLLLGTGSISNGDGTFSHWLFACDVAIGTVSFQTRLAQDMSDPEAVEEVGGLFLVQSREGPEGRGHALLIDRRGTVRSQLNRQVVSAKQYDGDVVCLTSKDVVRVTSRGAFAWTVPFYGHQWIAGGSLIDLPGGDMIAFQFGRIADSGVTLIRFDPNTGKEKWKTYCTALGVTHSKYAHDASVAIDGEKVRVTSKGSGIFVEVLDLNTGRQLERTLKDRSSVKSKVR
jgi:outer membrane protein assembly factor BamB